MKKLLLCLSFALLLTACNKPSDSESINSSSQSIASSEVSSSEEMTSMEESSEVVSESTSEVSSSEIPIITGNKIKLNKYSSHPLSEPEVNKQLITFNPMGNLSDVWDYYRGDGVVVAVIDSGFDYDHPDFINSDGSSKISNKSAYIYTSNGQVKTEVGREKVNITDGDSHGTMCAGLLGASVNDYGISGIAPNVELMLIKIDKKAESMSEAFKYAADNGARVISTSLGAYPNVNGESSGDIHFSAGYDLTSAFTNNINYAYSKGVSIVAATGNSRTTTLSYPAGCDNVIGAGGLNAGSQTQIWDNGYEGSNYNGSKTYVDVFAPSDGIYAPGFDVSKNQPTYWGDAKGTSFAAPLIAGAIAMYYQKYPTHTNQDVEAALKNSCVNISSYNSNKNMGWGRLDVGKFLNINQDIQSESYTPSTSINQKATKLTIVDEEGWDLRTLHLFNFSFASGYGYSELEDYFTYNYGTRKATASYQYEGTTRCWAYTDENYIGDYYLCNGNTDHAIATTYEYIFPWWVEGFSYQIVNNSNWLPEGGNHVSYSDGYGKDVKSYFWYDSETQNGVTQVTYGDYTNNCDGVKVTSVLLDNGAMVSNFETTISIFDYYEPSNSYSWFIDPECSVPYIRSKIIQDVVIYGKN